jgi:hypothetical protein
MTRRGSAANARRPLPPHERFAVRPFALAGLPES